MTGRVGRAGRPLMTGHAGRAVVFAVVLAGCVGPRDPLAGLHPVVWAEDGSVALRTCRWPDGASLAVALDGAPTRDERADLARALEAWSQVGLALELRMEAPDEEDAAPLRVRFRDEPPERDAGALGVGLATADCRRDGPGALVLDRARVEIARRVGPDWRGHFRPLSPDERLGALVHELGHALGFAGHARAGEGPMVAAPEAIRRIGRNVRRGGRLRAPGLRALYALPSGSLRRRVAVARWRTEAVDGFRPLARSTGLRGPWLRAGDRVARIFWRRPDGEPLGFLVPELRNVARDPQAIVVVADRALRRWLEAGAPRP